MSPTKLLNAMFNNRIFRYFIPAVNRLITLVVSNKNVKTSHDRKTGEFIYKEGERILGIDKDPMWNISLEKLKKALIQVPCKKYVPKEGDIVIDIGAGVGSETVIFQQLVGRTGFVYAIEAHPETHARLDRLCSLNNYKTVSTHQIAIGKCDGTINIQDGEHHQANQTSNINDGINIESKTLDTFVQEQEINRIDFLKVNIEGAEEEMILGMSNSIDIIKNLAISCHDFLENNSIERIKNKVTNFLQCNGFDVMHYENSHPVRNSWIYADKKALS